MQSTLIKFYFLLIIPMLLRCGSPQYLSEEDLNSFIRDEANGLTNKKKIGNVEMQVTYRPTDVLVMQELDDLGDAEEIMTLRDKYKDYCYFVLSLSANDRDILYGASVDQANFSDNLNTLSFRMAEHVRILTSMQDTVPVADYIYNRNFGISKTSSLLFVFDREKIEEAETFTVQTGEFGFQTGIQNFRFLKKDIKTVPMMKELIKENNS